jgi:hypothetical protein
MCEESENILYRNQIGTFYPLGQEKVRILSDEMNKIRNFGEIGM